MNRGPMGVKPQVENPMKIFKRLMEYVFRYYKFHYLAVIALIFVSVLANVQGTLFMKNLIDDYITPFLMTDEPDFTSGKCHCKDCNVLRRGDYLYLCV